MKTHPLFHPWGPTLGLTLICGYTLMVPVNPFADLVVAAMDKTIANKTVTYDFARLMDDAKEIKCSEFADALISNM